MATLGNFGESTRGSDDWTDYTERLQQHFLANYVADAGKQRAILLSLCGPATYRTTKPYCIR